MKSLKLICTAVVLLTLAVFNASAEVYNLSNEGTTLSVTTSAQGIAVSGKDTNILEVHLVRFISDEDFTLYERMDASYSMPTKETINLKAYSGANDFFDRYGRFKYDDQDYGAVYTWKSSNTKVAKVDANGVVTSKTVGSTVITVKNQWGGAFSFKLTVFADGSKITNVQEKVKWIVDNYTDPDMSELQKVKVLHDWLIYNADYDYTYRNHGANGVLILGTGVCESYAKAYQLLLNRAGIKNMYVTGPTHAWNMVNIGGDWYHVDCTWDDKGTYPSYMNFLATDTFMSLDHTWKSSVKATSKKYNWIEEKKKATISGISQEPGTSNVVVTIQAGQVQGPGTTHIDGYMLSRSTSQSGKKEFLGWVHADQELTFIDRNAETGKKYYYWIKARTQYDNPFRTEHYISHGFQGGIGASDKAVAYTVMKAGPNVSKLTQSSGKVTIKWKKISGTQVYGVFRGEQDEYTGNVSYTFLGQAKGTTFDDKNVQLGKTYFYGISLSSGSGKNIVFGQMGKIMKITVKGKATANETETVAPGKVKWTSVEADGLVVTLTWRKVEDADGYSLYRAEEKDGKYNWVRTTKKTTWTDEVPGQGTWYYKVRAYILNSEGEKVYGDWASVREINVNNIQ